MRGTPSSFFPAVAALSLVALTAACSGSAEPASAGEPAAAAAVQLAAENVATATRATLSSGPVVSGQLTPAREATVRAQVGGSIVQLSVDRGQTVEANAVVARIAARDLEASHASAQAAVKSAETALTVARSEAQRVDALVTGGALAARDREQATNAVAVAEAQLAAARAREKSVWQQLDDTTVRAPFRGVVSARPASIGDVVAPGTELLTIIDPSSMRLEALVPSDQIGQVRPGATVQFRVRGMDGTFEGRVDRLDSTADPITRQVAVFVTLRNTGGKLIAGLFAEGRIQTTTREGVVVPLAAIDETGAMPMATKVVGGKAQQVAVAIGVRQAETEQVEITKGLSEGDIVIVGSAKAVASGTPVTVLP
jgi:RND family efflux transporter MFP subunit